MAESEFTPIETVVTHECNDAKGFWGELTLPRVDEDDPQFDLVQKLNEMMQQIEDRFNLLNKSEPIVACVINGAVVLNCADGDNFEIDMTTDINSITFKNCDNPGTRIDTLFRNVGTQDFTISGWPSDIVCAECGDVVTPRTISPGANVRQPFSVNRHGKPVERGTPSATEDTDPVAPKSGGGGGGETTDAAGGICKCGPEEELNVVTCIPFDCTDATPLFKALACGGKVPYRWSTTAGTLEVSGFFDNVGRVAPKASVNNFTGITAFYTCGWPTSKFTSPACQKVSSLGLDVESFDCDGVFNGCVSVSSSGCASSCDPDSHLVCSGDPECSLPTCSGTVCNGLVNASCIHDVRTAAMITDGCDPCGTQMDGAVITVTDADGVSVATVLSSF